MSSCGGCSKSKSSSNSMKAPRAVRRRYDQTPRAWRRFGGETDEPRGCRGSDTNYRPRRTESRLARAGLAVVRSLVCAGGNNSVVECDLAKVEVAGSNPVSRSNFRSYLRTRVSDRLASQSEGCPAEARAPSEGGPHPSSTRTSQISAPSPSGKAEVCKTSIPGSNPGGASNPKIS